MENCQTPWRIDCIFWCFKSLARTRGGALHQLIRILWSIESVESDYCVPIRTLQTSWSRCARTRQTIVQSQRKRKTEICEDDR